MIQTVVLDVFSVFFFSSLRHLMLTVSVNSYQMQTLNTWFSLFSGSLVINGNTSCSTANSKVSPESCCSWLEDRCNGHAPGRFSSPASGLSGFSSSVMSATSESAHSTQSGYSSGRDGQKTHNYTYFTHTHVTHLTGNTLSPQCSVHQISSSVLWILRMQTN